MKQTKIDLLTWKRKNHYHFYKAFSDPCFNICSSIDVTNAVDWAKKNNYSIFLTLLYLSSSAMNQIDAFKLRMDNDEVWKMAKIHPSATVLRDDDTFNFCDFELVDDFTDFINLAEIARKNALNCEPLVSVKSDANQIYYSVIPWFEFTSFKHASAEGKRDVPKVVFGKITAYQNKLKMPVSVELHHALADGVDIGKYLVLFQKMIDQVELLC